MLIIIQCVNRFCKIILIRVKSLKFNYLKLEMDFDRYIYDEDDKIKVYYYLIIY